MTCIFIEWTKKYKISFQRKILYGLWEVENNTINMSETSISARKGETEDKIN